MFRPPYQISQFNRFGCCELCGKRKSQNQANCSQNGHGIILGSLYKQAKGNQGFVDGFISAWRIQQGRQIA